MLLTELKEIALRAGEDRRRVTQAINPIISYFHSLQRGGPGPEDRSSHTDPSVEWYTDNIGSLTPSELYKEYGPNLGYYIYGFGPHRKANLDYLVSTYYEDGSGVDTYEMSSWTMPSILGPDSKSFRPGMGESTRKNYQDLLDKIYPEER